jgi:diketogulonate reductase-like aldo/keto reductase
MSSLVFANGDPMASLGLGTWKASPGEVGGAVTAALELGYRHLDCASIYGNEAEIGASLERAWGIACGTAVIPKSIHPQRLAANLAAPTTWPTSGMNRSAGPEPGSGLGQCESEAMDQHGGSASAGLRARPSSSSDGICVVRGC